MFNKLFRGKRRDPRIEAASFVSAVESNSRMSDLMYGRSNALVHSCVSRIVSRAIVAVPTSRDGKIQTSLNYPNKDKMSNKDWWNTFFTNLLTNGSVVYARDDPKYGKGVVIAQPGSATIKNGRWEISVLDRGRMGIGDNESSTRSLGVVASGVGVVRLLPRGDSTILGGSPLSVLSKELNAYDKAVDLMVSYLRRGHVIGGTLTFDKSLQDGEDAANKIKDFSDSMRGADTYGTSLIPEGFKYDTHTTAIPGFTEAINTATRAVARFYGVPIQLLQVSSAGDRVSPEELEDHLLRDAVIPVLRLAGSSLSKFFNSAVYFDESKLGMPSASGRAKMLQILAQTGCLTIDECRAKLGMPALPNDEGKKLPAPAGAPPPVDRNDKSKTA